jgi:glutathione peroxidase-family protein
MLKRLSQMRSDKFEILIFPCNQFGQQEPGSPDEVARFARSNGFGGIIMSKGSVNGASTRPTFHFLKAYTSKKMINW